MIKNLITAFVFCAAPLWAADEPQTPLNDPYESVMWPYHQIELLGDPQQISFDERIKVEAPASAEDSFQVPVLIDASAIPDVEEIVVSVDFGPIPKIASYFPGKAYPKIGLRFKIDQATPVRASVRTKSGAWYVGSSYIDAAGGGCTAPATAYASDDWADHLGEVRARYWPDTGRFRMIVDHPMDTGLADGIPIFIIENLEVSQDGDPISRIDLFEPINEDPTFTLFFDPETTRGPLSLKGRDNGGNEIAATITTEGL